MAVTNLTGYTWVGKDTIDLSPNTSFNLNFEYTFFSTQRIGMRFDLNLFDGEAVYSYGESMWDVDLVYASSWLEESPKTIKITGGSDVENTYVINWLKANGSLTPPPGIANKLLAVNQVKQDIKEAIENKNVDLTGVEFDGYAVKIDTLPAVVELTQAQYDALSVYDNNTYYLIVEDE